jgi:hypothetical protein
MLGIMPAYDQNYIKFFELLEHNQMNDVYESVLWSDPCDPGDDFKANQGRPLFSPASTQQFLSSNKLDMVFRAHQVQSRGTGLFFAILMLMLFFYI